MNIVVLLSGGKGLRMRGKLPKQHMVVEGGQIIEYTLSAFDQNDDVDAIMVVSNREYLPQVEKLRARFSKMKWIIPGGENRIRSAECAVRYLGDQGICEDEDKIIMSDAVRPCISLREVQELLDALNDYEAATTGVEIYETVLRVNEGTMTDIIPREGVIRQTSPEGYRFGMLRRLYLETEDEKIAQYRNIGIDQLYEECIPVGIVKSNPLNFKITTQEDLILFETVLKRGFEKIICGI